VILPCPKCGASVESQASTATCGACGATFVAGEVKTTPDAAPPADPNVNTVIGGCRLHERVGAGGMGVVYKAEQLSLGRVVAVKLLPEALQNDAQIRDRFQREISILASLNHPNIVHILDGGISDRGAFFVMEFVDGISLRRIMTSGGVKPDEALRIVPQLCDALEYAHGRGVVHRDIKPENILIDKMGRVRLLDFGLSKLAKAEEPGLLTRPTQVLGSFEYMAPEQREASRDVDHRADLFALGVVLYELLTGELPIGRFDPPSQRNVKIDVRLDEVVLHALEKSPDRRYQKASEIKEQVERITQTPPPPVSTPATAPWMAAPPLPQPPPPPGVNPVAAGWNKGWGGPAQLPSVAVWIAFGILIIAGISSSSWLALALALGLLGYGYKRLAYAPCKVNQWIVFGALTIMAIASCDPGRIGVVFTDWTGQAPFVYARPWIAALLLMPLLVYLTDRLADKFARPGHAPLWILLGVFGIAGVESGSILFALLAGGAILFVDHLIAGRARAPHGQAPPAPPSQPLTPPPARPAAPAPSSSFAAPAPSSSFAAPAPPSMPSTPSAPSTPRWEPPRYEPPHLALDARPLTRPSSPDAAVAGPLPVSKWALWALWLSLIGTAVIALTFASLFAFQR
jgi:hypothetical protein